MPGDFSPEQEDGHASVSVQGQSTQKHELTPNGVTAVAPCPTPDCPYTANDQCAMLGCPQRFKRRDGV